VTRKVLPMDGRVKSQPVFSGIRRVITERLRVKAGVGRGCERGQGGCVQSLSDWRGAIFPSGVRRWPRAGGFSLGPGPVLVATKLRADESMTTICKPCWEGESLRP
jgi:hypothetical protein